MALRNLADKHAEEIEENQHAQGQCNTWRRQEESVQSRINFLKLIADVIVDLLHCAYPRNCMICKLNDLARYLVPFAVSAADVLSRLNAA